MGKSTSFIVSSWVSFLAFVNWMLNFPGHKRIRILLKDAQAGLLAKVIPLAAVDRAWVILRLLKFAAAGSFVLWFVLSFRYIVVH